MNNIALFKKYVAKLDEVFKWASITQVLDSGSALAREGANTNEIIVQKMSMDGLKDYNRNSGYVSGDVNLTNETVTFNYDRGLKFAVDTMDNEETAFMAFGRLAGEFIRTQASPELDAFRFAQYAGTSGISTADGTLTTGEDVLGALLAAQNRMDEDEVPESERLLFITPTLFNAIYAIDNYKSKAVLDSFSSIKKVPQNRFYTAVDLLDGSTAGETMGGYRKNANGKDINFLIVHKPAVMQYRKHLVNKVISPELNQTSDGWLFFYRSYGLTDVYENKVAGLYLHHKA